MGARIWSVSGWGLPFELVAVLLHRVSLFLADTYFLLLSRSVIMQVHVASECDRDPHGRRGDADASLCRVLAPSAHLLPHDRRPHQHHKYARIPTAPHCTEEPVSCFAALLFH